MTHPAPKGRSFPGGTPSSRAPQSAGAAGMIRTELSQSAAYGLVARDRAEFGASALQSLSPKACA